MSRLSSYPMSGPRRHSEALLDDPYGDYPESDADYAWCSGDEDDSDRYPIGPDRAMRQYSLPHNGGLARRGSQYRDTTASVPMLSQQVPYVEQHLPLSRSSSSGFGASGRTVYIFPPKLMRIHVRIDGYDGPGETFTAVTANMPIKALAAAICPGMGAALDNNIDAGIPHRNMDSAARVSAQTRGRDGLTAVQNVNETLKWFRERYGPDSVLVLQPQGRVALRGSMGYGPPRLLSSGYDRFDA